MWNPWKPNRSIAATEAPSPTPRSSFQSYHFVVRDFLIALGIVFGVIGVLVAGLLIWKRCIKRKAFDQEFDREQERLAKRTNSVRSARGVNAAAAAAGERSSMQGLQTDYRHGQGQGYGHGGQRTWQIEDGR